MGEWKPVETLEDLDTLDTDEIVEGYRDGLRGAPEPGNNRTRSYWHGWRNGSIDSHRIPSDASSQALARAAVKGGRLG